MAVCTSCGAQSEEGKRFCGDCGSPLEAACPSCGAPTAPGKRFCGDCGAPLAEAAAAAQRPTPVAERRLVSVLFADLVGFTSLAEDRDSEEVREPANAYARAAAIFREFAMSFWLAVTQTEHSEWLAVQGKMDEANPLLSEAHATFQGLDAKPWLERVEALAPQAAEVIVPQPTTASSS